MAAGVGGEGEGLPWSVGTRRTPVLGAPETG
jgi:hypothetical protein